MGSLTDAVLPLVRARTDLHRWSAANSYGHGVHQAVALLRAAAQTQPAAEVSPVTQRALASALKAIARADDSSGIIGDAIKDLLALHVDLAAEGSDKQKEILGDPSLLPKPWDPPTGADPQLRAELWAWLDAVVAWFNHEYVWDPASMIPPCRPKHPHLVHEIAVLADQRRRAGLALTSNGFEEWHRYTVPGFTERMKSGLKTHCDQDHQPWPARGRHTRYQDAGHHAERAEAFGSDVARCSTVELRLQAKSRLALVDTQTGEVHE